MTLKENPILDPLAQESKIVPVKWQYIFVMLGTLLSILVALLAPSILGDEFRNDVVTILKVGNTPADQRAGDEGSFAVIADFYRFLGMLQHPTLAAIFGVVLGSIVLSIALWRAGGLKLNLWTMGIFAGCFILNGVFLGQLTKEVIIAMLVGFVLALPRGRWYEVAICAAILLVGVGFRNYWALLLVVYAVVRLIPPKGIEVRGRHLGYANPWVFLGLLAIASIGMSLAIAVFTGDGGDHFRTAVNQWRKDDGSTASLISPYVQIWAPMDGIVNNLITTMFLVVPLPLLILLKPYYVASALLLLLLWSCFFVGYSKLRSSDQVWANRALAMMAGFLIVQGVFEPDYGSALRHLVPLVPMLFLLQSFTVEDNPRNDPAEGKKSNVAG